MLFRKPIFVFISTGFVTASPARDLNVEYGYACSLYNNVLISFQLTKKDRRYQDTLWILLKT
jgi:hypothetical protein